VGGTEARFPVVLAQTGAAVITEEGVGLTVMIAFPPVVPAQPLASTTEVTL
jgi:hypothetical protein